MKKPSAQPGKTAPRNLVLGKFFGLCLFFVLAYCAAVPGERLAWGRGLPGDVLWASLALLACVVILGVLAYAELYLPSEPQE